MRDLGMDTLLAMDWRNICVHAQLWQNRTGETSRKPAHVDQIPHISASAIDFSINSINESYLIHKFPRPLNDQHDQKLVKDLLVRVVNRKSISISELDTCCKIKILVSPISSCVCIFFVFSLGGENGLLYLSLNH